MFAVYVYVVPAGMFCCCRAEDAEGLNLTVQLHFTDTKESFRLQAVHSILLVDQIPPPAQTPPPARDDASADVTVTMTTRVFKDIALERRLAVTAVNEGAMKMDGSMGDFKQLLALIS